jgi:c-di-GMP-binding flagellar brake protein YcgR
VSDNRRSTRHLVSIAATLTADGSSVDATLVNISLGGALVASTGKHSMGQNVQLSFRVPRLEHLIEINATVRWADTNGVGLQFDGLRARDVWALNEYFKRLP